MKVLIPAREVEFHRCWSDCPYYRKDECMWCEHPSLTTFEEKFIISWDEDILYGFPSKCPLVKEAKTNEK